MSSSKKVKEVGKPEKFLGVDTQAEASAKCDELLGYLTELTELLVTGKYVDALSTNNKITQSLKSLKNLVG